MKIKNVALMGAGAIGAYFIRGLSRDEAIDFAVVAEGERAARLATEGIVVNSETFVPRVKTPDEAHGADLLIISVKYGALRASLDEIARIVGPDTVVMSVLNGIDSEQIVGERVGMEHMLYSLMRVTSRRVGREIVIPPHQIGVIFGEKGGGEPSERMLSIGALFEEAGIGYRYSSHIEVNMWGKFAINVSHNLPQAVLGIGAGCYEDSEYMGHLRAKLRDEVAAVAAAQGIHFDPDKSVLDLSNPAFKATRYSTLQDLDAGRHTEIEMFAGTMVRLGEELGVPTPYSDAMYCLIKALEEKGDGRFDY